MDKRIAILLCGIFGVSILLLHEAGVRIKNIEKSLMSILSEEREIDFHTPAFSSGYYLPEKITGQLRLGPDRGVIIVAGVSTIDTDAHLTIEKGTTLAVNEYGGIVVQGILTAIGTPREPISFITNELHQGNRVWNGIFFTQGSSATIDHAIFHHASPAMSCAEHANVSISHTVFLFGNLEVFGPCSYT